MTTGIRMQCICIQPKKYSLFILFLFSTLFFYQCQKDDEKSPEPSTLTTNVISDVTINTATAGGNISTDGGAEITARGTVWNITTAPTISLSTKTSDGTGTGAFISSLTGLSPATKYFARAYATNAAGTSYGNEVNFTTPATTSTVTSGAAINVTSTTAKSGGTIESDGGASVTARGIVWDLNPAPTTSLTTKTTDGAGTTAFTSSITGLAPATKYYLRAYAVNSAGTSYGSEIAFTTLSNEIMAPPAFFNLNAFYKKYLSASGIPIASSEKVSDVALFNVQKTITRMTSLRSDVVAKMLTNKIRVGILAKTEVTTDMPEHSDLYTAFPGTDWNTRARGLGATIDRPLSSCAEENVACFGQGNDSYFNEDILVHEFSHSIHLLGIVFVDTNFNTELQKAFNDAKTQGLWLNTYAGSNYIEYFAEGVQDWYNVNAEAIPSNGIHNQINTREELKNYDPTLYNIIKRYFSEEVNGISCHPQTTGG